MPVTLQVISDLQQIPDRCFIDVIIDEDRVCIILELFSNQLCSGYSPGSRRANDLIELIAFLQEIDDFRACVNAEMEWHQAAAGAHQQQARAIVDAWNRFVRENLNAPEDFPWPPEDEQ